MSAITPNLPKSLRTKFSLYRLRRRAVWAVAGLLISLAVLAGAVGLAVAADRFLRLPTWPRAILLVAVLGSFGFCLFRWAIYRAARRFGDRDAAVGLGQKFPSAEEDLVTAVEFTDKNADEQGVSPALLSSALQQIEARTQPVDPRPAVPLRPTFEAAAAACALLAAVVGAYLLRPEAVRNALDRLFRPAANVPYFCYTRLVVRPGNMVIRSGDAVEVTADVGGKRPASALLEGRSGSEDLRVDVPVDSGQGTWKSAPLFQDLAYRLRAGDAISDWFRIRVLAPPALAAKSLVLQAPAYAGSTTSTVDKPDGPVEIVAGTSVIVRGVPIDRGGEGQLRCTGAMTFDGQQSTLTTEASGTLVSKAFQPVGSGDCTIELTDGYGLKSRTPDTVSLKVHPDRKPTVRVTKPDRDLVLLSSEKVAVEAAAEDEFGVRELAMATRVLKVVDPSRPASDSEVRWSVKKLKEGGPQARKVAGQTVLAVDELGIQPGQVLEYQARASDFADSANVRTSASRTYRITVLSEAEHLDMVLKQLRQLQVELLMQSQLQKAEAARAGELAKQKPGKEVSDQARSAQQRENQIGKSTENLAKKFEELVPEMSRNPSTPPELMSGMEKMSRAVKSVAQQPMQEMAGHLNQAAQNQEDQPKDLQQAEQSGSEAAKQLQQLAEMLEQLQRQSLLEKLAAQAERLAARQKEIQAGTGALAPKTVGRGLKDLPEEERGQLQAITEGQTGVKTGSDALAGDIERAAASLSATNVQDAVKAAKAGEKLKSDNVSGQAEAVAAQLAQNVLFSQMPVQQGIAESLLEVAKILRDKKSQDPGEQVAKELEEFIRRQTKINEDIGLAIEQHSSGKTVLDLGDKQGRLQRDVSETAAALRWLERELEGFQSQTAGNLEGASAEMKLGADDLYSAKPPPALQHGKNALALLLEARKSFQQERQQMQQAQQQMQNFEAMLLLQKLIAGQKKVNEETATADEARKDMEAHNQKSAALARHQSELHQDAARLEQMISDMADAAKVVALAGEKMNISRLGLEHADTGKETRVVQKQAVALLELLLKDCCNKSGAGGARMAAMMQMMGRAGANAGGYTGGSNAPVLPTEVDLATDENWRRTHSKFEERLGASFESQAPAEFRSLLNSYFDRLRNEGK